MKISFSRIKSFSEKFKREPKPPKHPKLDAFCNRYALILHAVAAFLGYFVIEALARHSVSAAFVFLDDHTKVFLYNTLLIFITTLPVFLFRKRKFWRIIITAIWGILGVSNSVLLANRVTPLTGPDLTMIREGGSVLTKYLSGWQIVLVVIGIVVLIVYLIKQLVTGPKYTGKMHRIPVLIGIALSCFGFFWLTKACIRQRLLSSYFENIAYAYQDYGFPYCLTVTLFDTGIDRPDNYSEELISNIIADERDTQTTTRDTDSLPNVIIVQCETFFDPTRIKWLSFNEDPLPNWHKLEQEYTSGLYTAPVVGAGTINTEFETLTGMSMRFFGAGEYPYKSVLVDETCESAAYVLKNLGYGTHAIHDNEANFYSRRRVYANLGFDSFTSGEYMDTQDDVNENNWMRDENLIGPIGDALDSTAGKDFVFTVSVQPHGAYPSEHTIENPAITVSGTKNDAQNAAWEYYVNQLHEEDQFVADLIDYVEDRGEPTVIMFYGDHLPTMNLQNSDLNDGSSIYQTNYLIWDNIGLTKQDKDIAAYQSVADIFDKLDIHDGVMFRFQQTMQDSESYTFDMQALQYDILYGKKYCYKESGQKFKKTSMTMGVKDVAIDSIETLNDGSLYVHGHNFTQSCKVVIDDEMVDDTVYVDNKTLLVRGANLKDDSVIKVEVQSNSSTHRPLTYSNEYDYGDFLKRQEEASSTGTEAAAQTSEPAGSASSASSQSGSSGESTEVVGQQLGGGSSGSGENAGTAGGNQ